MDFTATLLAWYDENKRSLPWRNSRNPYEIWLSEVILQQTRVEQGLPYYERFLKNFPTVFDLAKADEDTVLKLWQGLGYYSRARNLHHTAKIVVQDFGGIFPNTYEDLLKLKGIGSYTAAAISSFAYHHPNAVVDGNVFRFLSRYFGIYTPINTGIGKKEFESIANTLISHKFPADFNQAIMEFGSIQCKPNRPDCGACVFVAECIAYRDNVIHLLPVKGKKSAIKDRYFYYLYIEKGKEMALHKRTDNDIWKSLYELPLIELDSAVSMEDLQESDEWKRLFHRTKIVVQSCSEKIIHKLSHQAIHAVFIHLVVKKSDVFPSDFIWIKKEYHHTFAVPRLIENFLIHRLAKR